MSENFGTAIVCTALYCEAQHNIARHLENRFKEGYELIFRMPYGSIAKQYSKAKHNVLLSNEQAEAINFYVNRDLLYRLDVWQERLESNKCNDWSFSEAISILSERRKALRELQKYWS